MMQQVIGFLPCRGQWDAGMVSPTLFVYHAQLRCGYRQLQPLARRSCLPLCRQVSEDNTAVEITSGRALGPLITGIKF